jgi:hypothetical protein
VGTISDSNYQGSSTGTLVIGKATAAVTLGSLSQTYTGSPLAATATTMPSGLTITFTYNGSSSAPTAAGSYTVVGTISDSNYQGSSTGTLVIGKTALTVTANPASSVYGMAFPTFSGTLTGVVAGDGITATYATTATPTSPAGGAYSITAILVDPNSKLGNYTVSNTPATLTITKATVVIVWTTPAAISYGTALSATQLDANSAVAGSFVYTPAAGAVLAVGPQTLSVTLNPTDSTDYTTATATVLLTVNATAQTISFTAPASVSYGTAPIALSATGGASGNPVTFSALSGPGSISGNALTINGTGLVVVAANQAGNANYAAATQVTQSIVVNPAASAVTLASSASTVLVQNAVTLTATVSSSAGVPTGTVNFLDGTTPLGTGTLSGGVAMLTTSLLAVGTHSISAVYSGGSDFAAATSSVLSQSVMDISLSDTSSSGSSQTITPGGSSTYSLAIQPDGGTFFPVAITLTVSGLAAPATASITPPAWALTANSPWTWTLPANTPLSGTSQLTIQMAQAQAQGKKAAGGYSASRLGLFSLALLMLPFAGRMRRAGNRLRCAAFLLLLLAASMATMAGLTGCGSPNVNFTQQAESYTLTVTVSAGALSHSIPITLLVE